MPEDLQAPLVERMATLTGMLLSDNEHERRYAEIWLDQWWTVWERWNRRISA